MTAFPDDFLNLVPSSAESPQASPADVGVEQAVVGFSGERGPARLARGIKQGHQADGFTGVRRRLQQGVNGAAGVAAADVPDDVTAVEAFRSMGPSFAEADPMAAGELLRLIPTEAGVDGGLVLSSEVNGGFRAEIRSWLEDLRRRDPIASSELRSNTPRDDAIDILGGRILAQASQSKTGVWTAALPNGRQLALVKKEILSALGVDQLVRAIHHQAICIAAEQGDRFNEAALRSYKAPAPGMSTAGGY